MNARYLSEAERVRAALAAIPADDYTTWVDMAFAVKNGLGEVGFDIWDEWSRSAHNYSERAARTTWRSAGESGGKTLATLFWVAQQHGFDVKGSRLARAYDAPVPAPRPSAEYLRREARVRARHAAVAHEAQTILDQARPVGPGHPYLERKQVRAVPTLRELDAGELAALLGYAPLSAGEELTGRVLIVPVDVGDVLSTLELIDADGRKSALAGGAKSGGWWMVTSTMSKVPVDGGTGPILIAEGVATALSAWQATGWFTVAALSSGNLRPVAEAWREWYPDAPMLVLADLGPGHEHAEQAAQAVSAGLATPRFAPAAQIAGKVPTDFNDMAVLSGVDAVGELLREVIRNVPLPARKEVDEPGSLRTGMGVSPASVEGNVMGNVKEKLLGEGDVPVSTPARRPSSKRRSGKSAEPAPASASVQQDPPAQVPVPAAAPADPPKPEVPEAAPASTQGRQEAAPPGGATRRQAGPVLYGLDDVPNEMKALAQHRFGAQIRMATPRENGGPYRGEVFNTEHYLIQEVATRSVVFHRKDGMEFVSDRLRWMDENQRLNGADVQIGYEGSRSRVYPWDRQRELLDRAVASLKKSASEMGLGEEVHQTLDKLQATSWARVRDARAAALAQSKERGSHEQAEERQR